MKYCVLSGLNKHECVSDCAKPVFAEHYIPVLTVIQVIGLIEERLYSTLYQY